MAPTERTSWSKVIALCSSIGVPLISVGCWVIIQGTHLVDKVDNISTHQQIQDADIKGIWEEIKTLHRQVDTISLHQHDFQFIYQKQIGAAVIEKKVNGKLVFIPYK